MKMKVFHTRASRPPPVLCAGRGIANRFKIHLKKLKAASHVHSLPGTLLITWHRCFVDGLLVAIMRFHYLCLACMFFLILCSSLTWMIPISPRSPVHLIYLSCSLPYIHFLKCSFKNKKKYFHHLRLWNDHFLFPGNWCWQRSYFGSL